MQITRQYKRAVSQHVLPVLKKHVNWGQRIINWQTPVMYYRPLLGGIPKEIQCCYDLPELQDKLKVLPLLRACAMIQWDPSLVSYSNEGGNQYQYYTLSQSGVLVDYGGVLFGTTLCDGASISILPSLERTLTFIKKISKLSYRNLKEVDALNHLPHTVSLTSLITVLILQYPNLRFFSPLFVRG